MITRDIGNNYSQLCADATKLLKDNKMLDSNEELLDINDYFTKLGSLKNLVIAGKADPRFLILPGKEDEKPFEIDANTRTIKIPDAFKNGIGVQGDNFAEIIYFSIDRYFDATDLFTQEAFIQWEAPAQGANQKDTGLTYAINKTVNLEAGKVFFGWPISENITKVPGNLKFSVRFFTREPDEKDSKKFILKYNFSTLTATIKINPGLDFDLSEDTYYQALLEDNRDAVMALYKNNEIRGLDANAIFPTFVDWVPSIGSYDLTDEKLANNNGFSTRAKLIPNEDKNLNGFGKISYKWYYSAIADEDGSEIVENAKKEYYKETTDPVNLDDKGEFYYVKDGDTYRSYDSQTDEGKTIYYKYTSYMPDKAGYYYAEATNTAGKENFAKTKSEKWLINFAIPPEISIKGLEHTIMKNDSATLSPTITTTGGETTYQWYKKVNKEDQPTEINGQINGTLTVSEEGYYSIKAINERNKDTKKITSGDMRVTYPASEFTLTYSYGGQEASGATFDPESILPLSVRINFVNPNRTDNYTIEWFEKTSKTEAISLGIGETCTPNHTGTYYAKVTNQYNENTSVINESPELVTTVFILSV